MSKLSKKIADRLKSIRTQKGLSQGDVATRVGVERSYISALENDRVNFSLKTLEKIVAALGVSSEDISIDINSGNESVEARLPFIKGLLLKKLARWEGKEWYHQRFDGCPYLLHMIAEAETWTDRDTSKKEGLGFSVHYCFFEEGRADWYILQDDIDRVAKLIVERSKKNPDYVSELIVSWGAKEKEFYSKCSEIGNKDLRTLSDLELISLHDEFVDIAVQRNSSSSIIDGFALGTDALLESRLRGVYEKSSLKNSVSFSEVFATLTAPIRKSFLAEAEKELYETVTAIDQNPERKEVLTEQYRDRFFWIRNNYVDSLDLPTHYFEDEIARIRSSGIDAVTQARDIDESIKATEKKKKEYREALGLDVETDILIRTTEAFTHWQDDRKKSTFFATHYFLLLLREISARTHVPIDLMKYMSPRQVSTIFRNPPDLLELKELKTNGVFYWDAEGHDCVSEDTVEMIRTAIVRHSDTEDLKDFRGLSASLGKVTGPVKVLATARDIGKIEPGDILVAVMTRPDYVPAMKKAAAIVTDEGGITSHAAIVSRELKIPCIIGTKVATRVLKDGDIVEVNANHGVVRRIK